MSTVTIDPTNYVATWTEEGLRIVGAGFDPSEDTRQDAHWKYTPDDGTQGGQGSYGAYNWANPDGTVDVLEERRFIVRNHHTPGSLEVYVTQTLGSQTVPVT